MKVFYIDIEEFKNNHDKKILEPFADIEIKSEKRFYEYTLGRYLVKNVAQKIYNLKNPKIIISDNKKPVFEDIPLHFSISHSKNIVIVCFNEHPCGIDLEYIKKRNLESLSDYYGQNFNSEEEFYKFWTLNEASYKLNEKVKYKYAGKFTDNYYLSIVSSEKFDKNIKIEKFC